MMHVLGCLIRVGLSRLNPRNLHATTHYILELFSCFIDQGPVGVFDLGIIGSVGHRLVGVGYLSSMLRIDFRFRFRFSHLWVRNWICIATEIEILSKVMLATRQSRKKIGWLCFIPRRAFAKYFLARLFAMVKPHLVAFPTRVYRTI